MKGLVVGAEQEVKGMVEGVEGFRRGGVVGSRVDDGAEAQEGRRGCEPGDARDGWAVGVGWGQRGWLRRAWVVSGRVGWSGSYKWWWDRI